MKKLLVIWIVVIMAACTKYPKVDSISVSPRLETNAGKQTKLQVYHAPLDATAPETYVYSSSDPYIATIDDSGIIRSLHVGTCSISVKTVDQRLSCQCSITVKPKNNLYQEPVTDFGVSLADVKVKEQRTCLQEIENMLIYEDKATPVISVFYLFDNNKKLISSGIRLIGIQDEKLIEFLTERYEPFEPENDILIWKGKGVEIAVEHIEGKYLIAYKSYINRTETQNLANIIELIKASSY